MRRRVVSGEVLSAVIERLREVREGAGLNQYEAADLLEVDRSTYSRYERGLTEIPLVVFLRACEVFKVSPWWLLGMAEEPERWRALDPEAAEALGQLDPAGQRVLMLELVPLVRRITELGDELNRGWRMGRR